MSHPVLVIDDSQLCYRIVTEVATDYPQLSPIIEAKNTVIGLEMLGSIKAELVIIKYDMPFMNGYEFLRKVFKMGARTRYIVIVADTLGEEIQALYARDDISAILHEKDIHSEMFQAAISKAVSDIEISKTQGEIIYEYEKILKNSLKKLNIDRQLVLSELISGIYPGEAILKSVFSVPDSQSFWLAIAEVARKKAPCELYISKKSISALSEYMVHHPGQYRGTDLIEIHGGKLCIVVSPDSPVTERGTVEAFDAFFSEFSEIASWLGLPELEFTFCDQPVSLSEFAVYYKEINDFSRYRFFHYDAGILKLSMAKKSEIMREDNAIKDLLVKIAFLTGEHDENALLLSLDDLSKKLRAAASFRVFSYAWNRLFFFCNLEAQRLSVPEEEFSSDIVQNDFANVDEAMACMIEKYKELMSIVNCRSSQGNELTAKALAYITSNYSAQLSLTTVADKINVSSAYLSRLFTKETGRSYVDHLNRIRISEAQKLLREGNIRINEVADQTGYRNVKYFSQIFRKQTGYTPYEYKIQAQNKAKSGEDRIGDRSES